MSAREAGTTDPQQRVFLESAHAALGDAGYDPSRYPGSIGVFAGSGSPASPPPPDADDPVAGCWETLPGRRRRDGIAVIPLALLGL